MCMMIIYSTKLTSTKCSFRRPWKLPWNAVVLEVCELSCAVTASNPIWFLCKEAQGRASQERHKAQVRARANRRRPGEWPPCLISALKLFRFRNADYSRRPRDDPGWARRLNEYSFRGNLSLRLESHSFNANSTRNTEINRKVISSLKFTAVHNPLFGRCCAWRERGRTTKNF